MKARYTYSVLFILLLLSLHSQALEATDTIYKNKPKAENPKSKIFVPPFILKTSPTAILWGGVFPYTSEYRLMAEITSGRRQSQQFGVSYLAKNLLLGPVERAAGIGYDQTYKVSGWRVQYAIKLFWIGRNRYAPYGFYFGPMVSYANARVAIGLKRYYQDVYFDFRHFNLNGIIGVQAGKMDRVTVDIYAGLGYKNNKVFYHPNSYKLLTYDTTEFGPLYNSHLNGVFGVNVGYSF